MPAPHPDIEPIAFLLGTWAGPGTGEYPTIETFGYGETIEIGHVGKPFLSYGQRTKAADDGRPLHAETGYFRPVGDGRIELVVAQPTGFTEILEGTVEGTTISLRSVSIGRTSTAKDVSATERRFALADGVLTITMAMAAMGQPLTHHLRSELTGQ